MEYEERTHHEPEGEVTHYDEILEVVEAQLEAGEDDLAAALWALP